MEIKNASAINVKSSSLSPFVQQALSGYGQGGQWLSPSFAFWLWEKSDTVGDSCDRIATAFQQIQPALRDKKTGEFLTKESDHPLLALLEDPGNRMSGDRFKYELMTSFCVTGNCFPVATGNIKYEPAGLFNMSANYADLIEGGDGYLKTITFSDNKDRNIYERQTIPKRKQWIYQAENKLSETIQILQKSRRYGLEAQSPLDRVYYQATTKYYGNVHNAGIMKNASRPGGIWTPKEGALSQDQYEAFKNEIRNSFSGPANAGKNIIAPKAIEYKNLLLNTSDMDFIELIENSRKEIYNIYQIPLALVTSETMTMSNFSNAIAAFYDLAVLPRAKFLFKQLGNFLLPRYKDGDRYELTIDEKQLPALKERLFTRAKLMREAGIYSDNEIRNETGYEKYENGDEIYKPANLIPTGTEDEYLNSDNEGSDNGVDNATI